MRFRRMIMPVAAMVALTVTHGMAQAQTSRADQSDQRKAAGQKAGSAADSRAGSGSLADEAAARRRAPAGELKVPGRVVDRVAGDDLRASERFTRPSLDRLKQRLESAAGHRRESFGFYYDARRDTVVLEGNVARSRLPQKALASGRLVVKHTNETRRLGRYNDTPPFWGGAAIFNGGVRCSSGFTVRNNSTGARHMVTAGHCGPLGSVWTSGSGQYFGTMTQRASFPTWDLALLSGASYGTYIYMGNQTGVGTPTGAAGDPVVGFSYCSSGSTTFESCGKTATSLSGTFCDAAGCTPGLATFTGTAVGPGDSGGPIVFKSGTRVYPRAVVIAGGGSTTWAEKVSTVQSYFGVTVVATS
ncbi:MAG: S1 family peptidase [Nocardioides sp.]